MYKVEVYQDRGGTYRWTLFSSNGRKVADPGEGWGIGNKEGDLEHGRTPP